MRSYPCSNRFCSWKHRSVLELGSSVFRRKVTVPVKFRRYSLVLVICATAVFSQPTPKPDLPLRVEVVSPKEARSVWLEILRDGLPLAAIVTAIASLRSVKKSNQNSQEILEKSIKHNADLQTQRLSHETATNDSKHQQEEMRAVQEWFLSVYSTEAIEPLELVIFWLDELVAYNSDDVIPCRRSEASVHVSCTNSNGYRPRGIRDFV